MHLQYGIPSLALTCFLLFMMVSHGIDGHYAHDHKQSGSKRTAPEENYKYRNDKELLYAFFTTNDLKVGRTMPLFIGGALFPSGSPEFLPKSQADSIPFTLSQLPYLLKLFGFEEGSPQAMAMKDTLTSCEDKAADAETTKSCVTSSESMLDFVHKVLGTNSASMLKLEGPKPTKPLQNFTILKEPIGRATNISVGCHMAPYAYAVYYCHSLVGENKVYEITLKGEFDEAPVKGVAVCHMDTSHHDHNHVVFRFLGIKAGEAGVCHVFPVEDLMWLPADASHDKCKESEEGQKSSTSKIMSIVGEMLD